MATDILAEEQLKLELLRVLSKYFLRQLENLLRDKTGAFFPVDRLSNLELGRRLGKRKELQLMTVSVCDALHNREFKVDLAFKFHENSDAAIEEANGAAWLEDLLKTNNRLKTAQLLYFSKEHSLLIYEGLSNPTEFFENELDLPQKLFLAGSALPYIHGLFEQKIVVDRYLHLITETLNGLNISPNDRDELNYLFKHPLKQMGLSLAGAHCFGDFHPGNLMFYESDTSHANTGDIRIDKTIIYLIDPAFIERDSFVDRAEDVGTFFSKFAYNDFSLTQNFDKTVSDIELFCKGYDYTCSYNGVYFPDYYPEGTTFDFHIALGILIDSLFKTRLAGYSPPDSVSPLVQTSIEAAKYILERRPFQIYS
ncbi:hypothetical protein CEE45_03375 [Candidatus Heimdallarchaeota archaeon B3_Heim]|nr:MAG: hypothetical protein CEE45_03375 [Candidatus Heimdallarchaeota archaeon B3_Heim]